MHHYSVKIMFSQEIDSAPNTTLHCIVYVLPGLILRTKELSQGFYSNWVLFCVNPIGEDLSNQFDHSNCYCTKAVFDEQLLTVHEYSLSNHWILT